jgi:hypothetical protein
VYHVKISFWPLGKKHRSKTLKVIKIGCKKEGLGLSCQYEVLNSDPRISKGRKGKCFAPSLKRGKPLEILQAVLTSICEKTNNEDEQRTHIL